MSENVNKNMNEKNEIEKLADAKLNDDATESAAGGNGVIDAGDRSLSMVGLDDRGDQGRPFFGVPDSIRYPD